MRTLAVLTLSMTLAACNLMSGETDPPYEPVTEADAPTVASLKQNGLVVIDTMETSCEVPGEPDTACTATAAIFMDEGEELAGWDAEHAKEWSQYRYVCPAMIGVDSSNWKCRAQVAENGTNT